MEQLKVGSVGLGAISGGVHLPGITRSRDMVLYALCDIDEKRLAQRAEEYQIPKERCFTDYHDLIALPEIDVVDIATPNDVHCEIAAAAAKAGKHYGVEKPVTMNTDEALFLRDVTKEHNVKSMIYFSYRYKAAARFMRKLVRSGKIGKIHHVNMQYYQSWGLEKYNTPLVWRYVKSKTASGALGDLGCHALDLVSFVVGESYEKTAAHLDTILHERKKPDGSGMGTVDVDDFSNILCAMTGGISASFQISRFAYSRGNYQRMEVYGEKGAFVYHLDRAPGIDDELEIATDETKGLYTPLAIPESCRVDQMQSLADLILGRGDGLSATIEDGVVNQRLLDGILRASKTGAWVNVTE